MLGTLQDKTLCSKITPDCFKEQFGSEKIFTRNNEKIKIWQVGNKPEETDVARNLIVSTPGTLNRTLNLTAAPYSTGTLTSGYSGYSGVSGYLGASGVSGYSGVSGVGRFCPQTIDWTGMTHNYRVGRSMTDEDIWCYRPKNSPIVFPYTTTIYHHTPSDAI